MPLLEHISNCSLERSYMPERAKGEAAQIRAINLGTIKTVIEE